MKPMISTLRSSILLGLGSLLLATGANAQDFYISGSLGQSLAPDLKTSGHLTGPFTTGSVTGVNPAVTVPAGTPLSWNTNLGDDTFYSIAIGLNSNLLRYEFEYSRVDFDIDSHRGINVGGLAAGQLDAGVALSGNTGDLGFSLADAFGNDGGSLETHSYMINAYYDFDIGAPVTPYIGLGLGNTTYEVRYTPAGARLIDDESNKFTWQLMAGASYDISDVLKVQASWRYRDGESPASDSLQLPSRLKFDMDGFHTVDVGIRYAF